MQMQMQMEVKRIGKLEQRKSKQKKTLEVVKKECFEVTLIVAEPLLSEVCVVLCVAFEGLCCVLCLCETVFVTH